MMIPAQPPLDGIRILVVEDLADLALAVSDGLRRMGATVELKASARQARNRLLQDPVPQVVLLDHRLVGHETGLDLALWMRAQPGLQQTARISYSGTDPATLRQGWPDAQVFHQVISKPTSLSVLVEHITQALAEMRAANAP